MKAKTVKQKCLFLFLLVGLTGLIPNTKTGSRPNTKKEDFIGQLTVWQRHLNAGYTSSIKDSKEEIKAAIEKNDPDIFSNVADLIDEWGETALIIAARFSDIDMATFILENTKNETFKKGAKDSINKTSSTKVSYQITAESKITLDRPSALDWAIEHKNEAMQTLLKKHGAKTSLEIQKEETEK